LNNGGSGRPRLGEHPPPDVLVQVILVPVVVSVLVPVLLLVFVLVPGVLTVVFVIAAVVVVLIVGLDRAGGLSRRSRRSWR